MLGMHIDVAISYFASNPKDIYVIPSLIGKPITKRSLIVMPSPYFRPKLLRPHHLALKRKFPLELSDISVVRDILDVFLEVLPCCHMTMLSSS
jgi:hypothetical protein